MGRRNPFFATESDNSSIASRNVFLSLLKALMVAFIVMLLLIAEQKENDDVGRSLGTIRVEIIWPEGNVDVDLWIKPPGSRPIGYSNKDGTLFNLVRDDTGTIADPTPLNYEVAFGRGLEEGEYIVNLHLYRNDSPLKVVPVQVVITFTGTDAIEKTAPKPKDVYSGTVTLTQTGQELTVVRFRLDKAGNIVPGSMNTIPASIRDKQGDGL